MKHAIMNLNSPYFSVLVQVGVQTMVVDGSFNEGEEAFWHRVED